MGDEWGGNSYREDRRGGGGGNNYREDRRGDGGGGGYGGGGYGGGGGRRDDRNSNSGGQNWRDDKFETMYVPSMKVGKIIGRGGSKINELQGESGARIQVTKDVEGDDTIVKLFGSDSCVARAKELINDLVTEPDRRY
ncbi:unnamed protein product [Psylliodes chrysocephalus]|uniref:K Homology domain-containing protein n=1 Tax=Psylliodes chrysocephalus TaxID=3402493 RepID=A0A9P0G957_9CUCU|nr:unnamed protein product [Psylliodes chrysocephala]